MNEMTRPIEVITQEINFYKLQAGNAIIEIGKRLCEAKQCLAHGTWGAWLKDEVEFSERTAQNFMRIAREYTNPQLIADMGNSATKALLLLSLSADEREDFVAETHIIDGEAKSVEEMSTKEMERLVRELAEERAKTENLQSQLDLFQTEAEKEKDEAVDAVYRENEDKMDRLMQQKQAAEEARKAAEEKVVTMETELDELRMQADQTVLPDESELERIRRETEKIEKAKAEAAVKKKLQKAQKDLEKAQKEAREAEKAIEAHEAAQKEAEEAALQAKAELAQVRADMEKKMKTTGSADVAVFQVHFEAVQEEINKMVECITRMEEGGDEGAAKLRMALKALCQNVQDNL